MLKNKLFNWIITLSTIFMLCGCFETEQKSIQGQTMGTYYVIKYVNESSHPFWETLRDDINSRLEEVNNQMSTYRPKSELSQFNQFQHVNTPFPVSLAMMTVIKEAIHINKLTNGALDITIGPLVNLWGFGPEGRITKSPPEETLALRRQLIGIDKLAIDGNSLIKKIPQLYVDLSAIAKGYGVDVIAEYLESQNIHNYMVDIGGEVRTKGHNGKGVAWRIAIEKPSDKGLEQSVQEIIEPGNMSVATSGDYRNYFEQDGIFYSHTIDPKTGRPIIHNLISITVIAPTCMMADGLSTGINVLGAEKGMELAERLNLPVFMVVTTNKGFEERYSSAFKPYLVKKM
ncbi:FAD:protein FMN transferase [Arsenophonus nasoniae]|nr:FAD:protein FMN transferase [Arsenophonus nasoniae]WGM06540.1 FAD:protein FMN transferase [Arsenophonus nasoniae]WGM11479.1 FAD:protein FMN transferase [Arsenophonus nasoniae]WGM16175.1 FAD:protein FMN transferase [Arsenophonus nasoniae]